MKSDKELENPAQNFKLKKKFEGSLPKEDLSDVVKLEPSKHKLITFTLRLEFADKIKSTAKKNSNS